MNEKNAFPKRKWAIKTLAIFLVVMAFLTYFSNAIMLRSLPQVKAVYASQGAMQTSIQGTGKIMAQTQEEILAEDARVIDNVLVQLGDEVVEGQTIATMEEVNLEENVEYTAAKLKLETLVKEKQEGDIRAGLSTEKNDYTSLENTIQNARDSVSDATKQVSLARTRTSLESQVSSLGREVANLQGQSDSLNSEISAFSSGLNDAIVRRDGKQFEFELANADYQTKKSEYEAVRDAASDMTTPMTSGPDEHELWQIMENARGVMEAAKTELDAEQTIVNQLNQSISSKSTELGRVSTSLSNANTKLQDAEIKLSEAPELAAAQRTLTTAQRDLTAAEEALRTQQNEDMIDAALDEITDQEKQIEMTKAQEDLAKIEERLIKTEFLANASGIISAIEIQKGSTVVSEQKIAVIDLKEAGYRTVISFPINEATQFRAGMNAAVEDSTMVSMAEVSSIRSDPDNKNTHRLVTFKLIESGSGIWPGEDVTLKLMNQTLFFEAVFPSSAIKTDNDTGDFVYAMRSRSTPLGDRNLVIKIPVTVQKVSTDGSVKAVDPSALNNLPVIISSNKPIQEGSSVRLID